MDVGEFDRGGDLLAAVAGQLAGERVAKQLVASLRLAGAVQRGAYCGVGDVADERFGLAHGVVPPFVCVRWLNILGLFAERTPGAHVTRLVPIMIRRPRPRPGDIPG